MTGIVTKIGMGAALAATALAAAAPADAQRFRGGYHGRYDRGGNVAGAALLGGVVGLGVGAALAGGGGPYYGGGYGGGYYGPYYAPRVRYYAPPVIYRPRFRPRVVVVGRPYGYGRPYAYRGRAIRYGRRW